MSEAMIDAARSWRGLDKLVVTVQLADQLRDEELRLGISRGRWKRVAAQVAALHVVAARGYQEGQLLGTWEAPVEPEPDVDEECETPAQHAHRFHTRWCFEEARKMYESQQRLTTELVGVVVEIVRTFKPRETPAVSTPTEDEAASTLRMLLSAAMMPKGNANEDEREARGTSDNDSRQGPATEPGQAGQGPVG